MHVICVLFLCPLPRLSSMSVVFDFNASLNDAAPVFPMLLSVVFMKKKKSELFIDVIYALFLLSSQCRLSSVSVVFDFNASFNDVAPVSPMLLSVVFMKKRE